jgi:hypothetical protein
VDFAPPWFQVWYSLIVSSSFCVFSSFFDYATLYVASSFYDWSSIYGSCKSGMLISFVLSDALLKGAFAIEQLES